MPRKLDSVISEVPVFQGLEPAALTLIAGCAGNVRFAAGEPIARRGDPADHFYLVRHGDVALEVFVPGRGPVTLETLHPGEVFGWSWLFDPYRWHLDARALTRVGVTCFDGSCLRGKCADDPALGYALMGRFAQVLIERLQWMQFRLLDVYATEAPTGLRVL